MANSNNNYDIDNNGDPFHLTKLIENFIAANSQGNLKDERTTFSLMQPSMRIIDPQDDNPTTYQDIPLPPNADPATTILLGTIKIMNLPLHQQNQRISKLEKAQRSHSTLRRPHRQRSYSYSPRQEEESSRTPPRRGKARSLTPLSIRRSRESQSPSPCPRGRDPHLERNLLEITKK